MTDFMPEQASSQINTQTVREKKTEFLAGNNKLKKSIYVS